MPDPESSTVNTYDLVIIGGGLAGASLAAALGDTDLRVAVVEAIEFNAEEQPSYDERTIALTYSARHIFSQLEVWSSALEQEACAIDSIHISNRGHFGITHLDHTDVGTEALGYVVPTRALGQALMDRLAGFERLDFLCPFQAIAIAHTDDYAEVTIENSSSGKQQQLRGKLVVIADGGRSPLLRELGFERKAKTYSQSALLSIVKCSQPHQHRAYERFVENGPLALLPMSGQRFAVVWTLSPEDLAQIGDLDDTGFLQELQTVFGARAGRFSHPTPRKTYPLTKSELSTPWRERVLALGNAAHTVHPVAGQGFNLGLRDVAALAEHILLAEGQDIGTPDFLAAYADGRRRDTQQVGQFTDGLLRIFTHTSPLVQLSRNIGLFVVENLPSVKRALLKRSMGLSHHQPRLARGLKILPNPGNKP